MLGRGLFSCKHGCSIGLKSGGISTSSCFYSCSKSIFASFVSAIQSRGFYSHCPEPNWFRVRVRTAGFDLESLYQSKTRGVFLVWCRNRKLRRYFCTFCGHASQQKTLELQYFFKKKQKKNNYLTFWRERK